MVSTIVSCQHRDKSLPLWACPVLLHSEPHLSNRYYLGQPLSAHAQYDQNATYFYSQSLSPPSSLSLRLTNTASSLTSSSSHTCMNIVATFSTIFLSTLKGKTLVHPPCHLPLDYCNLFLSCLPDTKFTLLQYFKMLQTKPCPCLSVTPCHSSHSLNCFTGFPLTIRRNFKFLALTFMALHNSAQPALHVWLGLQLCSLSYWLSRADKCRN